jgi:hypothetical protein
VKDTVQLAPAATAEVVLQVLPEAENEVPAPTAPTVPNVTGKAFGLVNV